MKARRGTAWARTAWEAWGWTSATSRRVLSLGWALESKPMASVKQITSPGQQGGCVRSGINSLYIERSSSLDNQGGSHATEARAAASDSMSLQERHEVWATNETGTWLRLPAQEQTSGYGKYVVGLTATFHCLMKSAAALRARGGSGWCQICRLFGEASPVDPPPPEETGGSPGGALAAQGCRERP